MKKYKAEIISIGDELLAGYTVNTNASFISQKLLTIGLPVGWVTTISDAHDEILYALETANKRADVVIITGGLGPTPDDITKKTICEYFNTEMELNENVLDDVKTFLKTRGLSNLKSNLDQALVPKSAAIISNPLGTAPGLIFTKNKRYFFFLPGVSVEMKYMINEYILDYLSANLQLLPVHLRLLRTTGISEAKLYETLKDILESHPQFPAAFLPRYIGVDMRFRLISNQENEIREFEDFVNTIHKKAAKYIFTDQEIEAEQKLGQILNQHKLTLCTAESFTGGLIGDLITNIPGSSIYYMGGLITYSNESKTALLDVQTQTLEKYGAVSEQTALEMVNGAQKRFNTHCAISTTGIAGPAGATKTKPVGLCYIAARYKDKESVKEFHFGAHRLINKKRGAAAGLELLRRLILGIN
jgi:nicotinamide-nucleotide amidase